MGDISKISKIFKSSEKGIYVSVVTDVVTLVHPRRFVDGGEPQSGHAEVYKVVDFFYYAL